MLTNKKVYVGKHSKEIQEKAFALGWEWRIGKREVVNKGYPFLYFTNCKTIVGGSNVERFNDDDFQEITAEEILAMEVPKPKKLCKELGEVNGYYINEDGEILNFREWNPNFDISDFDDGCHFDILPTKEEAEAYKILPMLLQFRDRYNEGWKPDWKDEEYFSIGIDSSMNIEVRTDTRSVFTFKTMGLLHKFIDDFEEELEMVKPLL